MPPFAARRGKPDLRTGSDPSIRVLRPLDVHLAPNARTDARVWLLWTASKEQYPKSAGDHTPYGHNLTARDPGRCTTSTHALPLARGSSQTLNSD
jgi:hypothetical protein